MTIKAGGGKVRQHGRHTLGSAGAPPPVTNPYPYFTAVDMNTLPFQNAAGGWGAAMPLIPPTAPNPVTVVTVNNTTELVDALLTGNRIIRTVSGVTYGPSAAIGAINNIILEHHENAVLDTMIFGPLGFQEISTGFWLRPRSGQPFTGLIKNLRFGSVWRHRILEKCRMWSAHDTTEVDNALLQSPTELTGEYGCQYSAVVGCLLSSGAAGILDVGSHLGFFGNSILAGRTTPKPATQPESWASRYTNLSGPTVRMYNDIRTQWYHCSRNHPKDNGTTMVYEAYNRYFNVTEDRIFWNYPAGDGHTGYARGCWFLNNEIYVDGDVPLWPVNIQSDAGSNYVRMNGNTVNSRVALTSTIFAASQWGAGPLDFSNTGNIFNTLGVTPTAPAWNWPNSAGDPSSLPWT